MGEMRNEYKVLGKKYEEKIYVKEDGNLTLKLNIKGSRFHQLDKIYLAQFIAQRFFVDDAGNLLFHERWRIYQLRKSQILNTNSAPRS